MYSISQSGVGFTPEPKSSKVYFAGKIRKNCWRHSIVPGLRACDESPFERMALPITGTLYSYVGPFFASCDHGCAHGAATHGVENNPCMETQIGEWEDSVSSACLDGVDVADQIFVWIDAVDCFATLIEVGYALAKGKDIRVGFDDNLFLGGNEQRHEFWFLQTIASHYDYYSDAETAFYNLFGQGRML